MTVSTLNETQRGKETLEELMVSKFTRIEALARPMIEKMRQF